MRGEVSINVRYFITCSEDKVYSESKRYWPTHTCSSSAYAGIWNSFIDHNANSLSQLVPLSYAANGIVDCVVVSSSWFWRQLYSPLQAC